MYILPSDSVWEVLRIIEFMLSVILILYRVEPKCVPQNIKQKCNCVHTGFNIDITGKELSWTDKKKRREIFRR